VKYRRLPQKEELGHPGGPNGAQESGRRRGSLSDACMKKGNWLCQSDMIEKEAARSEPNQEKMRLQRTLNDMREDSDARLRVILESLASG
jgi:hypothetical protein